VPRFPNIAAERAKLGMSLADLARHLGVTRKTLYNWRRSGQIPEEAVIRLTEIFDKPREYLLREDL